MRLMDVWLNTAVREGFEGGRSVADIAEETGLPESEVLRRGAELKLVSNFAAALSDAQMSNSSSLH